MVAMACRMLLKVHQDLGGSRVLVEFWQEETHVEPIDLICRVVNLKVGCLEVSGRLQVSVYIRIIHTISVVRITLIDLRVAVV